MTKPNETAVVDPDAISVDGSEGTQDLSATENVEEETAGDEGIDYKARSIEMEANFKGLQGTVQRLVEMQNQSNTESAKSKDDALEAKFRGELEGMTENEARFATRAFELEMDNRKLRANIASTEPINQRLAKDAILAKLSRDYGVAPEFLEQMVAKYNHPLAAAAAAEAAHATRKQLERPKGNSRVEGSTGGGAGGDDAELATLANSGDWDAYWRLTDRQADQAARKR